MLTCEPPVQKPINKINWLSPIKISPLFHILVASIILKSSIYWFVHILTRFPIHTSSIEINIA